MRRWVAISNVAAFAFLIASSMIGQQSGGPRKTTTAPKDYWFNVDAEQVWLDTGLDLEKGDLVYVYGGVQACGGHRSLNKRTCRSHQLRRERYWRNSMRRRSRCSRLPKRSCRLSTLAISTWVSTAGNAPENFLQEFT